MVLAPTINFFFFHFAKKKKKKKLKKKKKKKKKINVRCAFNVRFGSLSAIRLFYFSNMAAPVYWPSSVVAIKMNKCDHLETKNFMVSVRNTKLIEEVFNDHHPGAEFEKTYTLKSQCKTQLNGHI